MLYEVLLNLVITTRPYQFGTKEEQQKIDNIVMEVNNASKVAGLPKGVYLKPQDANLKNSQVKGVVTSFVNGAHNEIEEYWEHQIQEYNLPVEFETVICLLFMRIDYLSLDIIDSRKHDLTIKGTNVSVLKVGRENLYKQIFAIKKALKLIDSSGRFDLIFQEIDTRIKKHIIQRLKPMFRKIELNKQAVAFTKAFPPNGNKTSWQSHLDWRDNQLKKIQTFPETPLFDDMTLKVTPITSDNILQALYEQIPRLNLSRRNTDISKSC